MLSKLAIVSAVAVSLLASVAPGALASEPMPGGTINFVAPYGSSFSSLDIQASPQTQDIFWAKAIHRSLYDWDASAGKPVLALASDVSVSDDSLVYTYTLRDGVQFHDGKPLTVDDIIWSYTRMMDPETAFPPARYIASVKGAVEYNEGKAEAISGLRKVDDRTLEITLTVPIDPGFLFMRTNTAIYPAGATDDAGFMSHPVGLGPYAFGEYVPGSRLTVNKFDKYYEEGQPYADTINIMIMGDASARDVAFRNKEIDVSVLGPSQYVAYRADPELSKNIIEVAEVYTRYVGFNPDYEPFKDKRVRQAINYAINSDLIIKRLAKDKAYRASGWLPLSSPAYDENAKPYAYDPEKAKELLAEAGYADGFEFELTATQNESWGLTIVEAIIPMLAQVGVTVKARPVESSVLSEVVPAGDFQAFMWSSETGPDSLTALRCFHSSTPQSSCNYQKFDNAEFDKLIDAASRAKVEDEKNDLLRQANNLLQEEAPVWFFNYNKAVMAHQPWLHGVQPNAMEMAIQAYEKLWVDDTAPSR
ncbi:ABC transporter substrate-binding protein [Nitratireductor aquimarinus]|uniref:ABC transporter substrate-binding protein n=1 Tax=Nitratireductor TaxID=245876 RepID=UPI0019D39FE8|nr:MULTISPECIES: ABC transporter substrate-binding protein [Nitratireductor]MBN7776569.1 ABC transporter substrate-binding protein [Nitratireductor pacificus]MBN7779436.1 ABC transporter substrate-binding protein [Nitratireductor pacificus]MBN7788243.1 ABC transporter substrate-binding protein [Nitratireductor aquimarinus]MBY6098290.1 ABC transporter substrate-binding protein [Nitratireductor aquimarinus]MCA1259269.1 ABC transporter substrate-binding protein [Nitratireductor aquimarinus]